MYSLQVRSQEYVQFVHVQASEFCTVLYKAVFIFIRAGRGSAPIFTFLHEGEINQLDALGYDIVWHRQALRAGSDALVIRIRVQTSFKHAACLKQLASNMLQTSFKHVPCSKQLA